jgi:outer membrane lipoprotein SlyB
MPKEAAWPVGFIAGAVLTALLADALGIGGIVRLVAAVAGGVLTGLLAEVLRKQAGSRGEDPRDPLGPS